MSEVAIRAMEHDDVPGIAALAARVPTAPHWPITEFARLVDVSHEAPDRRGAWTAAGPDGAVRAFAIASHVAGTAELEAVVTAPEHRRQGLGAQLVRAVLAWSESLDAERLVLEVRASNLDAFRLYQRLGFRQDGVRRGYYLQPAEDAILMSLQLGPLLAG
jgi:[ribosomal protein S18]-alanine N-acetyltransferase